VIHDPTPLFQVRGQKGKEEKFPKLLRHKDHQTSAQMSSALRLLSLSITKIGQGALIVV